MEETTKKGKIQLYLPEEREYFLKVLTDNLRDNNVPNWADSVRQVDAERPGLLRASSTASKKSYFAQLWKAHSPLKGIEKQAKKVLENMNREIDRKSLIEILKIKGKQFLITEWDTLKPGDKAKLLSDVIKLDANEEKIELERMKLDKNNSMMDSIAQALMSSDKKAILKKYEIELSPTDEHPIIIEGDAEYEISAGTEEIR